MGFKPNEFFIGLVEFITILLPGAALETIFITTYYDIKSINASITQAMPSVTVWIVFLFVAFALGCFLSSFSSGLDSIYDLVRREIYPYEENLEMAFFDKNAKPDPKPEDEQKEAKKYAIEKKQLYKEFKDKYVASYKRRLLLFFFEFETKIKIDNSFGQANSLRLAQSDKVQKASNTYKWASILLDHYFPIIGEQASRIMAISKFFRSIVVVSILLLVIQILGYIPFSKIISVAILILSFREYIVQRQKSTQFTYRSIVTLRETKNL